MELHTFCMYLIASQKYLTNRGGEVKHNLSFDFRGAAVLACVLLLATACTQKNSQTQTASQNRTLTAPCCSKQCYDMKSSTRHNISHSLRLRSQRRARRANHCRWIALVPVVRRPHEFMGTNPARRPTTRRPDHVDSAGLVYLIAGLALFAGWLRESDLRATRNTLTTKAPSHKKISALVPLWLIFFRSRVALRSPQVRWRSSPMSATARSL